MNTTHGDRIPITLPDSHFVNDTELQPPFPEDLETAIFGMGCFWGAEKRFWELDGVYTTAVGYAGGDVEHPTYHEVCSGDTDHAEVVLVVFDPEVIGYEQLLKTFWESHNPTQGFRQGNDVGSQYRSVIFTNSTDQNQIAKRSLEHYQDALSLNGQDRITTDIVPAPIFYYAEEKHQQYLAKHPNGYCGLGGTRVAYALDESSQAAPG